MHRRFALQLAHRPPTGPQTGEEREREARLLDRVAKSVDFMLRLPIGSSTIRHDQVNFHCVVGPKVERTIVRVGSGFGQDPTVQRLARIVIKRGCTALVWDVPEQTAFASLVATAYRRQYDGPPLRGQDGNLPRPVEETCPAATDRGDPTRRDV